MGGGGEQQRLQHHRYQGGGGRKAGVPPKGCVAIRVGGEGEEPQRFVVPVEYVNHPLFARLLEEAEKEYGFEQKGAITIPCHVEDFRHVRGIIDRDSSAAGHGHGHHVHLSGCFKPSKPEDLNYIF
ncbi:Indole-3-acetic acid-induced protein ARG7 [Apostasia shenzhenica]|uniref:Indole-3-acetic acid-induced protein ARG7 n=1 Tax=Apostasia shenzhenica TaxID=1088818 RepID=A0A2H9ZT79_9ASPA|nr:Indole-3-acetic acid-induced protein ARG7 [Apostasia shenzhenica]